MNNQFSVLVAARKNSKYLAKFLFGYFVNTKYDQQLLIMLNKNDTWNKELVEFYQAEYPDVIEFFYEDEGLGRGGLNVYFNKLLKHAINDWVIYFCEDHFINTPDWDDYFAGQIEEWGCGPKDIWLLIPKFDNVGSMNQIVSAGFIKAMGGNIGSHGNIDSYLNDVSRSLGPKYEKKIVRRFDEATFHDFTHDQPSPLDDCNTWVELSEAGRNLPKYTNHLVLDWIDKDADKLREAIDNDGLQR